MANALPILLLGGAAAFFLTQKPKKAIANGNGMPKGTAAGPKGHIPWRVIATGQGEYIAQWKLVKDVRWNDLQGTITGDPVSLGEEPSEAKVGDVFTVTFGSKEEAAESIVGAIEAGDIP